MVKCGTIADTTTYGILLGALGRAGLYVKAIRLWAKMVQHGMKPNKEAYNGILVALESQSNVEMGITFFKRMSEEGIDPDFVSCQAVSKLLCKAGQAVRTLELAQFIERKPLKMEVYESFIKVLGSAGYAQEVCLLVEGLMSDDIVPREATFLSLIDVLCLKDAEPRVVVAAMDEMEKSCGNLSSNSYNSILLSMCRNELFHLAFDVLKRCHKGGKFVDSDISNAIFVGISKLGKLHLVEGMFEELNIIGPAVEVTTFNALLDSSAQVGNIETTKRVLQIMEANLVYPNVDTYNAAIRCFSRAGRYNAALQVFNEMRMTGCVPNTSSYNSVLVTLRKAGLKDAVLSFFERMEADGIMPDPSTFAILADLDEDCAMLSRAYRMREAHNAVSY